MATVRYLVRDVSRALDLYVDQDDQNGNPVELFEPRS